ncbi:hypothetical protein [Vulcanisaeta sp. JCM 14467]|uniref:hypothetical protein n=1 Tax=Vulcanisaeta sp. JCM 14467 TaxID=1295370 RepID=UPI0006D1D2D9|nr:hypothetical protein [Vulcanisaeta sp. JCM 14467]
MGLSQEDKERLLRALEEDAEFRLAVVGLLGITDLQSSIRELTSAVRELVNGQGKILEIMRQLLENQERLWEGQNRLFEGQNRLWEIQGKLLEVVNKLLEVDKQLLENQEMMWRELRWLRGALLEIRNALGGGFEYYTANVVRTILRERGFDCEVLVNVTLPIDGYKEVDIFCPDPLVVGEVTMTLRSIEETNKELEKLNASVTVAEKFTGKKTYLKVLAVENAPSDVTQYLTEKAREQGIYLILGREYEKWY